jgi:HNH endonuclease
MERELEKLVWERAHFRCEYCQIHQEQSLFTFEIDHVIPKKHGGLTEAENLCLSCWYCNTFKGSDLVGINPHSGRVVRLFNPRKHSWKRCFAWQGPTLLGKNPTGHVTIAVLRINNPQALLLRQSLIDEGVFPP